MTDIRSLEQTLLDNLLQNKARLKFVARFLLALVSLRQNGGLCCKKYAGTQKC
jgi:hypothetical protein